VLFAAALSHFWALALCMCASFFRTQTQLSVKVDNSGTMLRRLYLWLRSWKSQAAAMVCARNLVSKGWIYSLGANWVASGFHCRVDLFLETFMFKRIFGALDCFLFWSSFSIQAMHNLEKAILIVIIGQK